MDLRESGGGAGGGLGTGEGLHRGKRREECYNYVLKTAGTLLLEDITMTQINKVLSIP